MFSDTMEDSLVAWEREEVRAHPGFGFYPHTVWNTLETMVQVLYIPLILYHPEILILFIINQTNPFHCGSVFLLILFFNQSFKITNGKPVSFFTSSFKLSLLLKDTQFFPFTCSFMYYHLLYYHNRCISISCSFQPNKSISLWLTRPSNCF